MKMMSLKKITQGAKMNVENLKNEIWAHWELQECAAVINLLELFIDDSEIYMVLEY